MSEKKFAKTKLCKACGTEAVKRASVCQQCGVKFGRTLGTKLFMGLGALAVASLIIGSVVSNVSAKAEVKAKVAEQIHQQIIKDTIAAELKVKQEVQAKAIADAKVVADAKAKAEADVKAVRAEDARIAEVDKAKAVQEAINKQKKANATPKVNETTGQNINVQGNMVNVPNAVKVTSGDQAGKIVLHVFFNDAAEYVAGSNSIEMNKGVRCYFVMASNLSSIEGGGNGSAGRYAVEISTGRTWVWDDGW